MLNGVRGKTEVSLVACNEETGVAQLRNNKCELENGVATFDDLRFVGRSGRGKAFNVVITIHTDPVQIATLQEVIKVQN